MYVKLLWCLSMKHAVHRVPLPPHYSLLNRLLLWAGYVRVPQAERDAESGQCSVNSVGSMAGKYVDRYLKENKISMQFVGIDSHTYPVLWPRHWSNNRGNTIVGATAGPTVVAYLGNVLTPRMLLLHPCSNRGRPCLQRRLARRLY